MKTVAPAYYSEWEPFAARWLRNLAAAGEIPAGVVDERDVRLVRPEDVAQYAVQHYFAGLAGWALALRLGGWPEGRPVWSASLPCQPFSSAGQGKGVEDERHLWPCFLSLVSALEPPTIFGEQVASKKGRAWLADVFIDLESVGYAVAAADLCASGVGAPHIRQRLFWCATRRGAADAEAPEKALKQNVLF